MNKFRNNNVKEWIETYELFNKIAQSTERSDLVFGFWFEGTIETTVRVHAKEKGENRSSLVGIFKVTEENLIVAIASYPVIKYQYNRKTGRIHVMDMEETSWKGNSKTLPAFIQDLVNKMETLAAVNTSISTQLQQALV